MRATPVVLLMVGAVILPVASIIFCNSTAAGPTAQGSFSYQECPGHAGSQGDVVAHNPSRSLLSMLITDGSDCNPLVLPANVYPASVTDTTAETTAIYQFPCEEDVCCVYVECLARAGCAGISTEIEWFPAFTPSPTPSPSPLPPPLPPVQFARDGGLAMGAPLGAALLFLAAAAAWTSANAVFITSEVLLLGCSFAIFFSLAQDAVLQAYWFCFALAACGANLVFVLLLRGRLRDALSAAARISTTARIAELPPAAADAFSVLHCAVPADAAPGEAYAAPLWPALVPAACQLDRTRALLAIGDSALLKLRTFWVRKVNFLDLGPLRAAVVASAAAAAIALVAIAIPFVGALLINYNFLACICTIVALGGLVPVCVFGLPRMRKTGPNVIFLLGVNGFVLFFFSFFIFANARTRANFSTGKTNTDGDDEIDETLDVPRAALAAFAAFCLSFMSSMFPLYAVLRTLHTRTGVALVPRCPDGVYSARLPRGTHVFISSTADDAGLLEHTLRAASSNGVTGISLRALQQLNALLLKRSKAAAGPDDLKVDFATGDVVYKVVKPLTASGLCTLHDLVLKAGAGGIDLGTPKTGPLVWAPKEADFGPATAFVSHAWMSPFGELIETLAARIERSKEQHAAAATSVTFVVDDSPRLRDDDIRTLPALAECEPRVWVDFVFKNQHEANGGTLTPAEYSRITKEQFMHTIGGPGVTYAMAAGVGSAVPISFTRVWCLYEFLSTIELGEAGSLVFMHDAPRGTKLSDYSALVLDATHYIKELRVDMASATAMNPLDRDMVHAEAHARGGFAVINAIIERAVKEGKCGRSPSPPTHTHTFPSLFPSSTFYLI
jgi:hypothetical protein